MLNRFVIPEKKLISRILKYKEQNIKPIIDYAVEDNNDIFVNFEKYKKILYAYPNNYHTIKLSGIDMNTPLLDTIIRTCSKTKNKLIIDAEEVGIQERVSKLTNECVNLRKCVVFKTYQMYNRNALYELENDINFFSNRNIALNVKLVWGCYLHVDKYTGSIYDTKQETDIAYDKAIEIIMNYEQNIGEVIFATHNKNSFNKIKDIESDKCYHATLMGFDEHLNWKGNIQKMVYIPFGPFYKTWPYLMRRLYENKDMIKYM